MERNTPTRIVNQYLAYWQEYIRPLEEQEQGRYSHFTTLLHAVGKNLYGIDFSLAFYLGVFQRLSNIPAGHLTDEG